MSVRIDDRCDGCGICELACPRGAVLKVADWFIVHPMLCNDCGVCIPICPDRAITTDRRWAVCRGRGCPLASGRLANWACREGLDACGRCGGPLWRAPSGGSLVCPSCDGQPAVCPKARKLARTSGMRRGGLGFPVFPR